MKYEKVKYVCVGVKSIIPKIYSDLKGHIKNVHEKKICTICGKMMSQGSWKQHMISIHSITVDVDKVLKCEVCQKGFAKPYKLREHMNTHTGTKPYKCKYCEQRFADSSNRLNHERAVHEGIKRSQQRKVVSTESLFI